MGNNETTGKTNEKSRTKKLLYLKKPKTWIITVAVVLCIGIIATYVMYMDKENDEPGTASDIIGYYEFYENIYTNPLSSFLPFKGYMPYFEITENALYIIPMDDGSAQEIAGTFDIKPLDKEEFELLFQMGFGKLDLSKYEECYQYAAFSADHAPEYRLYVMDGEVWLANLAHTNLAHTESIWSIYRLVKTDKVNK